MGTLHLQGILNKIQTCFDLPHYKMDTLLFFTLGQFALTTKIIVKYINCSFIENLEGNRDNGSIYMPSQVSNITKKTKFSHIS